MNILAINPWIYDFAAYDFWLKPYGFLVILSYLKSKGVHVDYIDCLGKKSLAGTYGRGKYEAVIVSKPDLFKTIPRRYKRYGIATEDFIERLPRSSPDYILITSSMTYWYPGVIEVASLCREKFPGVKIIIGGTYATLCKDHAQSLGIYDHIFSNDQLEDFFKLLSVDYNCDALYATLPDYRDFDDTLEYVVLRTSWGCPFNCSFCAIKILYPKSFIRLNLDTVFTYITSYTKLNVKDFVLYDDAFLFQSEYATELLGKIIRAKLNIRIHTPNALHIKYVDREIAQLLKDSGFTNPHFGLETLDPDLQKLWGDKVNRDDVMRGARSLLEAGYKKGEFSVYLLLGYPHQDFSELLEDIRFLNSLGIKVSLAEFSCVPKTTLFSHYGPQFKEPLLHNNSVFGFFGQEKIREFWEIKNYTRRLNKQLLQD